MEENQESNSLPKQPPRKHFKQKQHISRWVESEKKKNLVSSFETTLESCIRGYTYKFSISVITARILKF